MTLDYDDDADVLYIVFEETGGPFSYVENGRGDILRIDKPTNRVVGCTVPFLMKRFHVNSGEIRIPEVGGVPFNDEAKELLSA